MKSSVAAVFKCDGAASENGSCEAYSERWAHGIFRFPSCDLDARPTVEIGRG